MEYPISDLKELLDYQPSEVEERLPSFFELSGYPHYEDVLSNMYAFFLDPSEKHGLQHLFITSLCSIIKDKSSNRFDETAFDEPHIEREVKTNNNKYIDLVVYNSDPESGSLTNAIIIENKVNADLYNDLDDYYRSIDCPDENKAGIVFSLSGLDLSKKGDLIAKNYINITHFELCQEIQRNLGDFWQNGNEKFLILLKDLIQTIKTLSKTDMKISENVKFFFQNSAKINDLIKLRKEGIQFIYDKIQNTLIQSNWTGFRLNDSSISFKNESGNLVGYLYFGDYLNVDDDLYMEFWIRGENAVSKWLSDDCNNSLKNKCEEIGLNIEFNEESSGKEWLSFAWKYMKIKDKSELEKLDEIVGKELNETWNPVREVVEDLL